jgi:hypothetical protein
MLIRLPAKIPMTINVAALGSRWSRSSAASNMSAKINGRINSRISAMIRDRQPSRSGIAAMLLRVRRERRR